MKTNHPSFLFLAIALAGLLSHGLGFAIGALAWMV